MNKLCPECQSLGECWFKRKAENVAQCAVDLGEINTNQKLVNALTIHDTIADLRIGAREKCCPNVNKIDPDYLGKNLL